MKKLFSLLMAVMLTSVVAFAQQTVKGTVVYAGDDEPLAGATIQPVGGGVGVATDLDGHFSLTVPSSVKKLTVSYIGMVSQTVDITGKDLLIKLTNSANNLDEVMVVAYGTAKKSAYTGSASVVKADEIEGAMVTNAMNALKGTAAGVQVMSSNGQPGSSPAIYIRGVGSITASTAPLYVLDGMPYDGDIAAVNTMDIESITVLKDAAAAALYGARGANGVILITTKKGSEGNAKVTFDARWGSNSRQISNYDVIKSPDQYMEMAYTALYNAALATNDAAGAHAVANNNLLTAFGGGYQFYTVPSGQSLVGTNGKLNPNAKLGYSNGKNYITPDNWADGTYINGLRQEYNVSITGGNDKFDFYLSGGFLGDEGIITDSDYNRISTRTAVSYQAKKWLKVGTNMAFNHVTSGWPDEQNTTNSGQNAFLMANTIAPIYPMYVRDAEGNIIIDANSGRPVYDYGDGVVGSRTFYSKSNAVSDLIYSKREYLMDIFNGTWYATITPIENLNITGTLNYFLDNTRLHERTSSLYGQMAAYKGTAEQDANHTQALNIQALASYRHAIADVNHLDYLLGYESHDLYMESVAAWGYNLYNPDNWTVNNTLNGERRKGAGNANSYATRGIFGRVNYDYDGKYFGSVSYRRDASSRFAPNKRWGNFFSLSAAWDIKKESFMEPFTNVDMIKVKASFGQQGNDNLGSSSVFYYAYLDQYSLSGTDSWSDGTLLYKGNPDITWETSNNFNAGVDFSFFQGKIDGTIEYFQRQVSDMLYKKPVAPSNGYDFIYMNVGSMRNYGAEFELNFRPISNRDLTWEINLNGTLVRNKILKLSPDLNGELISGVRILREGESMYQYYMVKYAGVNPENGNPMYWTRDITGYEKDENGEDDPTKPIYGDEYKTENYDAAYQNNKCKTGNTMPSFFGGFGTSLKWKGFDFSIQFAYQLGGRVIDNSYISMMHSGSVADMGRNWHVDALKAWTPENTDTNIPRLNTLSKYSLNQSYLDFCLVSSDYLSLNNITVGYTLPQSITKKLCLESVRVYAAGDNLAIWTARKGLDPRGGFTSLSSNMNYSAVRNISGGLRVTF